MTARLQRLERRLSQLDEELRRESIAAEQLHVRQLETLPSPRGLEPRSLRCVGWKKTYQCRSTGRRFPSKDQPCDARVAGGSSGFCELQDVHTGAFVRVMETNCSTQPTTATHTCAVAPRFANVAVDIERLLRRQPQPLISTESRGIVVTVDTSDSDSLHALLDGLQQLRHVGCRLPIEVWVSASAARLPSFQAAVSALELRPIHVRDLQQAASSSPVASKLRALRGTAFAQALFLDLSSAIVLRDPTTLFSDPDLAITGAVFWPHVFHESTTETNLQRSSWLWELLDLPFVDMMEQDPRVLLLDRRHAGVAAGLELAELLANEPLIDELALVPGGHDLLRLAWLRRHVPFHLVSTPPSVVGTLLPPTAASFCGTHVLQHDTDGRAWVLLPRLLAPPDRRGGPVAQRLALSQLTHSQRLARGLQANEWRSAASQTGYEVQSVAVAAGTTCLRGSAALTTAPLAQDVLTALDAATARRRQRQDEQVALA
ncbi:hypothetical protein ATCC90586_004890 [Pythium insidiosum]|nr:hypothetical protein ATCC90586_004890 [Pythium insidiosum]